MKGRGRGHAAGAGHPGYYTHAQSLAYTLKAMLRAARVPCLMRLINNYIGWKRRGEEEREIENEEEEEIHRGNLLQAVGNCYS